MGELNGKNKDLALLGILKPSRVFMNPSVPLLYEEAIRRNEGTIVNGGPLVVRTGLRTGRSPNDRFIVKDDITGDKVSWGNINVPFEDGKFVALAKKILAYFDGKDVYVQDSYVCADQRHSIPVRIVTEHAWQGIFAKSLFRQVREPEKLVKQVPEFTVISAPGFRADPKEDGTNSEVFVILNFSRNMVIIGGTGYAGEIKKSVFTLLNFVLPLKNILSMHCSANVGEEGDVALFFGLSGTGKTTLSADPERSLIGDDEHGWTEEGIFNHEGGCYAKVIKLSSEHEPQIFATTERFGTVLENVVFDEVKRELDLNDASITENTRGAYPLSYIGNAELSGVGGHPKNLVMLTCDAFGVLPPVSRLSPEQAGYHFISGYTSKLAGTEVGITEPKTTFSTCFGAPFMALSPKVYSDLLRGKIAAHKTNCWLINTGWSGGPFGVGQRMSLPYTRAIVKSALKGLLDKVSYEKDPVFGLSIPKKCPGVPDSVLNPKNTWKDKKAYDDKARELAVRFNENFKKFTDVCPDIKCAGPLYK